MTLFSYHCDQCGTALDNRSAFHLCTVGGVHDRLTAAMLAHGTGEQVDSVLAECPDAECHECARIVCPHGEPLHFHHDGCPACAQHKGRSCALCGGLGFYGTPGKRCEICDGSGKAITPPASAAKATP